jgi:hypothetical protein
VVKPSQANQSATPIQGFQVESTPLNLRCPLVSRIVHECTPGRENRPPEAQPHDSNDSETRPNHSRHLSRSLFLTADDCDIINSRNQTSVFHHLRSIVTADRPCSPKTYLAFRPSNFVEQLVVRATSFIYRNTKSPATLKRHPRRYPELELLWNPGADSLEPTTFN